MIMMINRSSLCEKHRLSRVSFSLSNRFSCNFNQFILGKSICSKWRSILLSLYWSQLLFYLCHLEWKLDHWNLEVEHQECRWIKHVDLRDLRSRCNFAVNIRRSIVITWYSYLIISSIIFISLAFFIILFVHFPVKYPTIGAYYAIHD